jgi:hypothetical protein
VTRAPRGRSSRLWARAIGLGSLLLAALAACRSAEPELGRAWYQSSAGIEGEDLEQFLEDHRKAGIDPFGTEVLVLHYGVEWSRVRALMERAEAAGLPIAGVGIVCLEPF